MLLRFVTLQGGSDRTHSRKGTAVSYAIMKCAACAVGVGVLTALRLVHGPTYIALYTIACGAVPQRL